MVRQAPESDSLARASQPNLRFSAITAAGVGVVGNHLDRSAPIAIGSANTKAMMSVSGTWHQHSTSAGAALIEREFPAMRRRVPMQAQSRASTRATGQRPSAGDPYKEEVCLLDRSDYLPFRLTNRLIISARRSDIARYAYLPCDGR